MQEAEKQEAEKQEAEKQEAEKQEKKRGRKKVRVTEEEYRALKEKISQGETLYDRYLRLQAEFENTQKRHLREKEEYIRFAHGAMVWELLPVYDHLTIALSNIQALPEGGGNHDVILQGIRMIQSELWELLSRNGLSKIESVGKPFNPEEHEAVATVEDDYHSEGTVVEEIRPGFLLNGKLLRPASVKITKKKPEAKNHEQETKDPKKEQDDP